MKKNLTVLNQIGDYTLVKWGSQYVVAWKFDCIKLDWCQGHYFDNLNDAIKYFEDTTK